MSEPISSTLRSVIDKRLRGDTFQVVERSSRRGVTTFEVLADDEGAIIKLARKTDDGMAPDTEGIRREATVLTLVQTLTKQFEPQLYDEEEVALFEKWFKGEPAFKYAARDVVQRDLSSLCELLRRAYSALSSLHEVGWAHGDLQPNHFLRLGNGELVLLDYGQAQSAELPMPGFRGGMVHFNAPEICAAINAGTAVTATPTADVFGLAAVFAFAFLGVVYGRYNREASYEEACTAIANASFRRNELETILEHAPSTAAVLFACLEPDPKRRPEDAVAVLRLLESTMTNSL